MPANCAHCGNGFARKASTQKHCSPECRFRAIAAPFAGTDGCWNWPASTAASGYGQFTWTPRPNQVVKTAHRLSFELLVGGEIPPGMYVMHSCDNRRCFNPAHLRVGSPIENNRDMIAKGRQGWAEPDAWPTVVRRGWETRRARYGPSGIRAR